MRLERDTRAGHSRRIQRVKERIDAHVQVNHSEGPLSDGCEPLLALCMPALPGGQPALASIGGDALPPIF